jgi:hypothetical protein
MIVFTFRGISLRYICIFKIFDAPPQIMLGSAVLVKMVLGRNHMSSIFSRNIYQEQQVN